MSKEARPQKLTRHEGETSTELGDANEERGNLPPVFELPKPPEPNPELCCWLF